jgi:2'-5' RNA ligase
MTVHAPSGGGVALRLFAALPVAEEAAHLLADHVTQFAPEHRLRVVDPTALHLTFAFLGDVAEEHVPVVATALETAFNDVPGPTCARVAGASSYGNGSALGFDIDLDLLVPLDAARDRFLDAAAPYAPQLDRRPWHPHVTVARTQPGDLPQVEAPAASWIAADVRLFASLRGPGGRQHRQLHAIPLGMPARQP